MAMARPVLRSCRSDVPFCGQVCTSSKVLAQAWLIEVFLLLRCVVNKQVGPPPAACFGLGPQRAVLVAASRVFCPRCCGCLLIYKVLRCTARCLARHLRPSEGRQMANPNVRFQARGAGGSFPGLGMWPERVWRPCWSSLAAGGTADLQPLLSSLSVWQRGQKVAGGARRLLRWVI